MPQNRRRRGGVGISTRKKYDRTLEMFLVVYCKRLILENKYYTVENVVINQSRRFTKKIHNHYSCCPGRKQTGNDILQTRRRWRGCWKIRLKHIHFRNLGHNIWRPDLKRLYYICLLRLLYECVRIYLLYIHIEGYTMLDTYTCGFFENVLRRKRQMPRLARKKPIQFRRYSHSDRSRWFRRRGGPSTTYLESPIHVRNLWVFVQDPCGFYFTLQLKSID